jgi:hypothetical protein
MDKTLEIPHRVAPGLCPVNGIRDLIHFRTGRDWSNRFVHGLGQGGGFAYLRFGAAHPPRQVYWGIAGPRQHQYLAELLGAQYTAIENRTFKFSWAKATAALDGGTPPILGPLDMYHLPFYEELYHERHIPIHYLLLLGYDGESAFVLDTGNDGVQALHLDELRQAWDVNVPGLGKRNRLVVLDVPHEIPPTAELIRQAIADQCQNMLRPPVSMVGIPAMRKLAREIAGWPGELSGETADLCLRQVLEYLNSPPDLQGDHLTAGRDLYVGFLQEAGPMAALDFSPAIRHLEATIRSIPQLAATIRAGLLDEAARYILSIAEEEAAAYSILGEIVGVTESGAPS